MADKLPNLGNFNIPTSVIDTHEWATDSFIDTLGKTCQLVYPPKRTQCPKCFLDPRSGRSTNRYRSGGPVPFPNNTICPWCAGEGRKEKQATENINLRVYWSPREWIDIAPEQFKKSGDMVQVIGYLSQLPKVERAVEIIINHSISELTRLRCERAGEAVPHGFRQNRYFIQMLKRV